MEEDEVLPENLRCKRTDGRQWRCNRRVMDNKKLCEVHYIQGRHRQYRQKVPDSLKLERKNRKKQNQDPELHNLEIRAKKIVKKSKIVKAVKRKRSVGISEALDRALKKMKLKKGDLRLDLIREFLKRQVEKKKERELKRENEKELMRELPNGVMAISPSPPLQKFNNAGGFNVKLGLDSCSFPQRCFRSKNIEPVPIGTMQVLPYAKNVANLKRVKRKKCHWCRRTSCGSLIKGSSCRKHFFCIDCIQERYFDKRELKMACPVCCETCSCWTCSKNRSKDVKHKELHRDNKVKKIHLLHYLISTLFPVLEQINKYQSIELEIEAKTKGKIASEVKIEQIELGCKPHCCSICKSSIVDFHRICTNCSYNLCLSCCWEFRQGSLPGSLKAFKSRNPNGTNASTCNDKTVSKMKQISTLLRNLKVYADGSISCPHTDFGGGCDSLLELRCVFSFGWIKELEVCANRIVCSYDFPEASNISKAGGNDILQKVARREDSDDNFLFYPTVQDLNGNVEHFQKHWDKGHPVIVRNLLQNSSALSWDPLDMFSTYLEKKNVKSQDDRETVKATKCLDSFEVEIVTKQIFMGSIEGRTHANMLCEMLKLKCWLSSNLFLKQFPDHYAEIIRALPLQEYMNPISGLLNLPVKLPLEIPKPDLGPIMYISYAGPEELMQTDFLSKLCYDSYDMVNILAHTTDLPISTEQLTRIKKLMQKYNTQSNGESTRKSTDHQKTNEVNGKSSLSSESMEESSLQDMNGESLHLPNGIAKVSFSNVNELDSEASILCSGTVQSSEGSDAQDFFGDDLENSSCSEEKLGADSRGAQWDIFRRQDVPKLVEYLKRHSNEFCHTYCFPKHVVHPILDQIFFLDAFHKTRLKEEFNVEPWTFDQHLGEAVIIPAGCPYQIRKLKSCVNIVLDFISPENVTECINLTDELRILPAHHKAKEKMLEVKKMTVYGISAAIEEIRSLMRTETNYELME